MTATWTHQNPNRSDGRNTITTSRATGARHRVCFEHPNPPSHPNQPFAVDCRVACGGSCDTLGGPEGGNGERAPLAGALPSFTVHQKHPRRGWDGEGGGRTYLKNSEEGDGGAGGRGRRGWLFGIQWKARLKMERGNVTTDEPSLLCTRKQLKLPERKSRRHLF